MDLVDQLTEELTCQQVMLSSLEGESFDGVEAERDEITTDIARLERLLERAQRGEDAIEDAVGEPATEDDDSPQTLRQQPRQVVTPVHASANPVGNYSAGPSRSRQHDISTPSRVQEASSDAGSVSLPSRKRERTLTTSYGQQSANKSRRTTPTPMDSFSFGSSPTRASNLNGLDFIDLTGDNDNDVSATGNRRHQETEDEDLIMQLSSQAGSPSGNYPVSSGQSSAFDRIMSTEQLNPRLSDHRSSRFPSASPALRVDDGSIARQQPNFMPGSYNSSWDEPSYSRLTNSSPAPGSSTYGSRNTPGYRPPTFGAPSVPGAFNGHLTLPSIQDIGFGPGSDMAHFGHDSSFSGLSATPSQFGGVQMIAVPPHRFSDPAQQFTGPAQPFALPTQRFSLPKQPQNPLSSIIQRTSQFDFVNGTDESGDSMPERLTNYIHDLMHDSRVSDKELDDLLKNIRPDMDIPEMNRDGTPEGLKATLYQHQELALTWAKKMEEGSNKGGILADDMGLGKTISMISLMLTRKATSRPKTNLIVAPLALLRQWDEEIRSKIRSSHKLSTMIYHGKKSTTEELLMYDVVLTTYGTLAAELKRLDRLLLENGDRQVDFNDKAISAKLPLLHPTKAVFHRIILDEAQCIKNKETKTAKAAYRLRSTYRWCLTGTPMMNGVFELFSLLHFLRIKPYSQWTQFTSAFGTLFGRRGEPKPTAMTRLRALLKATMLRRKKDSQLDGKPIVRLPPKIEEEVHVELSPDERDYYNQLETKSRVLFNKYLREGTVGKNYSNILVLLLRLRQTCCHPHLNLDIPDGAAAITDEQMLQLVKDLDSSVVDRIKEIKDFECPVCYDAVPSPSFFVPCGHDSCQECLSRLVDAAQISGIQQGNEGRNGEEVTCRCPVCRGTFNAAKCFTYDAFRQVHMPETIKKEEVDDEETASEDETEVDSESDEYGDDVDDKGNLKDFVVDDFSDSDEGVKKPIKDEDSTSVRAPKVKKKKKKVKKNKGKEKAEEVRPSMLKSLRKEAPKNRAAFKKYMTYLRKTWLPSAKVTECMKLLKSIEEASGEKTIIFSQWTLLLDLVEVAMHHEGFKRKPERYDGSMSAIHRNNAATAFRNNPDVKVILVSLRAGNAGLNLTAASRVIILDPFWNPYIEMQAVDRAYRIGQQREVKVYRILTQETVEDRIIELQEKKKEVVEAALDESESRKIGRLSTSELKFLFNGTR